MMRTVLEEPMLLFLLVLVPSWLLLRKASFSNAHLHRLTILCCVIGVAVFAALGVLNLTRPGFIWHDEASILSVAAAYLHGGPLYHDRSGPALYSLLYGPSTFLVYVPFLWATAHPLQLVRWFGLVVYLADALLLYWILRGKVSAWAAAALLAAPLAVLLSSASHAFGVRGDPILLLCLCVGLLSVRLRNWPMAALLCGFASGAAVDFKLTVLPTVVLLLALLFRRRGLRALLLSSATALLVAATPFLLPLISMKNYISWLVLSSHQGLDSALLKANVLCAAFMLAPAIVIRIASNRTLLGRRKQDSVWIALLFLAALACCVLTGAKNGAGPWHVWPILPFAALWSAYEADESGREIGSRNVAAGAVSIIVAAIAVASSLVLLRLAYRDFRIVHPADLAVERRNENGAEAELTGIVASDSGRNLEMGYGRNVADYRSSLRFELPLKGQHLFLDEDALVELLKANASPSPDLIQHVLGCDSQWLIPHGEGPFQTLRAGVLPDRATPYLFPDDLRLGFAETHKLMKPGIYYDLWACPSQVDSASPID